MGQDGGILLFASFLLEFHQLLMVCLHFFHRSAFHKASNKGFLRRFPLLAIISMGIHRHSGAMLILQQQLRNEILYIVGILGNVLLDFCKTLSCQKGFRGTATIEPAPQTAPHQNQRIRTVNTAHLSLGKVHRQNSSVNIFLRNAFGTQSLQHRQDYRLHLLGILTVTAP